VDFTEATDSEWQWHQLGHMQVCTSFQTDNHASIPPLSFFLIFTGRMPFLPPNQQRQSTEANLQISTVYKGTNQQILTTGVVLETVVQWVGRAECKWNCACRQHVPVTMNLRRLEAVLTLFLAVHW